MWESFCFFAGWPKGDDPIGHAACVCVFRLAGGAAEVDRPAASVQRASDRLHPGPGVTGAGPRRGRPALQLRLQLQEGDHTWPHRVSREATETKYTIKDVEWINFEFSWPISGVGGWILDSIIAQASKRSILVINNLRCSGFQMLSVSCASFTLNHSPAHEWEWWLFLLLWNEVWSLFSSSLHVCPYVFRTLDDGVYRIALSLAKRYSVPLWEVYMTHLEFLFTDSGYKHTHTHTHTHNRPHITSPRAFFISLVCVC